jgi:uncharacterized protein GlcG (DUF336 family)
MKLSVKVLAAVGCAIAAPAGADSQGVLVQHDVGVHLGIAIAEAALAKCEADGVSASVAVVDRAGRLRVFLQGDQAAPHNIELARRKAYTALTFGISSADWNKRMNDTPDLSAQRQLHDVIGLAGGEPIKLGDDVIGAVGVSGSKKGGDEGCAMAGVAKAADLMK